MASVVTKEGEIRMVQKKVFISSICFFLVVIIALSIIVVWQRNQIQGKQAEKASANVNMIDLRYGDSFNELQIFDIEGNSVTFAFGEKNNILFYLSASCQSCVDVLRFSERLQAIFSEEDLRISFLWCDNIPVSLLEQYNINTENCYSTNGISALGASTPSAYIIDNQGRITYYNSDIKITIEKLYNQITDLQDNLEKLQLNANQYLMREFNLVDLTRKQVVYFYMEGCPDCAAADAILNSEDISKDFDLHYLYKYDDTEPFHFKDDYALFRLVYGIKWYPSFLVLQEDETYKIVGEVPLETLMNEIVGQ